MTTPASSEPRPEPPSLSIAYACIRYHPAPGGAETHVRALAQLMAARGHRVTVHTSDLYTEVPLVRLSQEHCQPQGPTSGDSENGSSDPPHRREMTKEEEWDGKVRVRRYRASTMSGELHYPSMPGMVRALLREPMDVLHVHSYGYFQTLAGALKRRLHDGSSDRGGNRPVLVFTPHFHPPWSMWGGDQRRAIRERIFDPLLGRWSVNAVDALVGVSAHELELLQEWVGFDESRSVVIPNGIHLGDWQPPPSGEPFLSAFAPLLWGTSEKQGPLVLYAGRLASNKGLTYLLRALPALLKQEPDLRLALVGADTGEGEGLLQLARELGVDDRITFTGHLDDALYRSAFGAADIFVLPSEYEAFGIVLLEAGVMELPCVGTRVGGVPEVIVEGETGLIAEYADVRGLEEALGRLLADPDLCRSMGETARQRVVAEFSWESVVDRVEALYRRLLAGVPP